MVDPNYHVLWSNDNQLEASGQRTWRDLQTCWLTSEEDGPRLDRVGSLLRAVATNLDSAKIGYRMAERLSGGQGDQLRALLGGGDWDTVEHAAMSLAVEDVVTAMDLCAAIIQSLVRPAPTRWGDRVWDINSVNASDIPATWVPLHGWLDNLRRHEHYRRLVAWRHAMVHRSYEKVSLSTQWSPTESVADEERAPSSIYVRAEDGSHLSFDLPDALGTVVLLGARQFQAFCIAVSQVAAMHRVTQVTMMDDQMDNPNRPKEDAADDPALRP
jgi:hypothetical protein